MKYVWIGLISAVALVVLFFALNTYIYNEKQEPNVVEPYRAELSGTLECLPHKDTSGPQTLECAYGLETDVGEHYGIDFALMSQSGIEFETGKRISASGVVTPIERLSSDQWMKYDIAGIFSVTSVESYEGLRRLEEPDSMSGAPCYVGGCSSQLCTDEPNMASTCEWRSEYACYQGATCERQADGQCGWTKTAELTACLLNPPGV